MSLRHSFTSRWLSQPFSLAKYASASPINRTGSSLPSTALRRAFSSTTNSSAPYLQSRISPSRMGFGGFAARDFHQPQRPAVFRRFFNSSRSRSYSSQSEQSGSLSQRLKRLSKEYGWSALWVYLLLSAMDFPFCFAAVRLLGVERIGRYEHAVVESFKGALETVWPSTQEAKSTSAEETSAEASDDKSQEQSAEEVQGKTNGDQASLWTQLVLAYAVHKSLIFIRVPLTAAITPKVVRILRQWGWDIVKGKPKGM